MAHGMLIRARSSFPPMKTSPRRLLAGISAAAILVGGSLSEMRAGPFILAGTDADDHGSFSGGNQDGWFFMQRALENLAPGVTTGIKTVTILGSTSSALTAASSAFNNSSLPGLGWSLQTVSTGNFGTFFGQGGNLNTGILMMDSGGNVGGGVAGSTFVPHANAINTFLGAGGGLFSQANGYQWVTALVPGLGVVGSQNTGLGLTPAGNAAFPGLTNQDLSAGPWHNYFTGVGSIPVLATSTVNNATFGQPVIIGSSGGSITNPNPVGVPDAGSFGLVYIALGGLLVWFRRFRTTRSA